MDAYEILDMIGTGTYGKVYKAKEKKTGQLVAIKKTKDGFDEGGISPCTIREISLLRILSQSLHIVRLLDVKHVKNKQGKTIVLLVFEHMDYDLKICIDYYKEKEKRMPPKLLKSFMYQLLKGVSYCHSLGILHRDLKPQNLLVDKEWGLIKIADLGLGRAFSVPVSIFSHQVMTLWYRAPEVLLGSDKYSTPVDMWSLGCIFAEMSRLNALFRGESEIGQLLCIFRCLGTPNEETWPGVTNLRDWHCYPQWKPQSLSVAVPDMETIGVDLLNKMLIFDPAKRISAKEALEHPYFDDIDKSQF